MIQQLKQSQLQLRTHFQQQQQHQQHTSLVKVSPPQRHKNPMLSSWNFVRHYSNYHPCTNRAKRYGFLHRTITCSCKPFFVPLFIVFCYSLYHPIFAYSNYNNICYKNVNNNNNSKRNDCNNPPHLNYDLKPCEIFMDSITRVALQSLRDQQRTNSNSNNHNGDNMNSSSTSSTSSTSSSSTGSSKENTLDMNLYQHVIDNCYHSYKNINEQIMTSLTLTLCGYKGGGIETQTNQDRAFVLSRSCSTNQNSNKKKQYDDQRNYQKLKPQIMLTRSTEEPKQSYNTNKVEQKLLLQQQPQIVVSGVLDGHGDSGHYVAEWSRYEIIKQLIIQNQHDIPTATDADPDNKDNSNNNRKDSKDQYYNDFIPKLLKHIMLDIDSKLPNEIAMDGGATATFVLQMKVVDDGSSSSSNDDDDGDEYETHSSTNYQPNDDDNDDDDDETMIYFCNVGDSQSFLVASVLIPTTVTENSNNNNNTEDGTSSSSSTSSSTIENLVYFATRLDKPDIPSEKERIEQIPGMTVKGGDDDDDDDDNDIARVWYKSNHRNGQRYGLAMSRGLGDREALGIIAEPTITIFKKQAVIRDVLQRFNERYPTNVSYKQEQQQCATTTTSIDPTSTTTTTITAPPITGTCKNSNIPTTRITSKHIQLFVVSATDGILDFIQPQDIANMIGSSLFDQHHHGHPVTATEDVIYQATTEWYKENQGQYRDDIAIAITTVI